jgi:hypothetical protein
MTSKLSGNGIYKGSLIILLEHREAYLNELNKQ